MRPALALLVCVAALTSGELDFAALQPAYAGIRPKLQQAIVAESALNDPTGAVVALTLLGTVAGGESLGAGPVVDFFPTAPIGQTRIEVQHDSVCILHLVVRRADP